MPEKGSAEADGVGPPFPCVSVQRRRNVVVRILAAPCHAVVVRCSLRPYSNRLRVRRPEDPTITLIPACSVRSFHASVPIRTSGGGFWQSRHQTVLVDHDDAVFFDADSPELESAVVGSKSCWTQPDVSAISIVFFMS